ncbi:unnamed protein product [Soboliphyme baturini]|uniref:Uncharacterized protein n=1 Tax=Soboliphyme baturini TaxID=241478 RepID=A0A183ITY2_9BILA|nr:unnamed protein product [Soboliphyme baturini]
MIDSATSSTIKAQQNRPVLPSVVGLLQANTVAGQANSWPFENTLVTCQTSCGLLTLATYKCRPFLGEARPQEPQEEVRKVKWGAVKAVDETAIKDGQEILNVNDNELSFKVHGKEEVNQRWLENVFLIPHHRQAPIDLDVIADKAYSLMKKASGQVLNDAEVIEAGVGSGEDRLPVRKRRDEQAVAPTIIICSVLVTSFFVLLLLYLYRNRRYRSDNRTFGGLDTQNPWLGKSSKDYEVKSLK